MKIKNDGKIKKDKIPYMKLNKYRVQNLITM